MSKGRNYSFGSLLLLRWHCVCVRITAIVARSPIAKVVAILMRRAAVIAVVVTAVVAIVIAAAAIAGTFAGVTAARKLQVARMITITISGRAEIFTILLPRRAVAAASVAAVPTIVRGASVIAGTCAGITADRGEILRIAGNIAITPTIRIPVHTVGSTLGAVSTAVVTAETSRKCAPRILLCNGK